MAIPKIIKSEDALVHEYPTFDVDPIMSEKYEEMENVTVTQQTEGVAVSDDDWGFEFKSFMMDFEHEKFRWNELFVLDHDPRDINGNVVLTSFARRRKKLSDVEVNNRFNTILKKRNPNGFFGFVRELKKERKKLGKKQKIKYEVLGWRIDRLNVHWFQEILRLVNLSGAPKFSENPEADIYKE
jgi:hypothetical protein